VALLFLADGCIFIHPQIDFLRKREGVGHCRMFSFVKIALKAKCLNFRNKQWGQLLIA
jgi:hypothetical protein